MKNKIKIPVERLRQIIQEEVNSFYNLEEDALVGDEEEEEEEQEYDEDELDEDLTVSGASEDTKRAVLDAIGRMDAKKATELGMKAGIPMNTRMT